MQPKNNDTAWDLSAVFNLLNGLPDVDIPSKNAEDDLASRSKNEYLHIKGSPSPHVSKGLGDFSQIWNALGVQYDEPAPAKPVFEASLASNPKLEDAYASDGALYYPPSSKSVHWRDEVHGEELADTQPDTPPESESKASKADKKKLKKQRKQEKELAQMAATLIQKRKIKKNDTGSQSDANISTTTKQLQTQHTTPTKKQKKNQKQQLLAGTGSTNSSDEAETIGSTPAQTAGRRVVKNSKNDGTVQGKAVPGNHNMRLDNPHSTGKVKTPEASPPKHNSTPGGRITLVKNTLLPPQITPQASTKKQDAFAKQHVAAVSHVQNDTIGNLQKQLNAQYQPFPNYATPPRKQRATTGNEVKPVLANGIDTRDFSKPSVTKADLSAFPILHTPARAKPKHELRPREDIDAVQRNWNLLSKLMKNFPEDNGTLLSPMQLSYNKQQPNGIHVFVDASNILIGFQEHLKRARGIPEHHHVPRVYPSFHALALLLERRRPIAKRVLAGSTPEIPDFERAREIGYETCILDKVYKAREMTERQKKFAARDAGGNTGYTSGSNSDSAGNGLSSSPSKNLYKAHPKWVEQAVDEILHLKILESIVDTPVSKDETPTAQRPTMVLATGDAAEAEYSSGFLKMVERALNNGWNVEVMAWSSSVSLEYRRFQKKKRESGRFKVVELDDYAEELFPNV